MTVNWVDELRRRGVLRVAALYLIGAWLVFQAADVFFPAWNIPDGALRYLLLAAALGFPIALFLGWRYDVTASGVVLTPPAGDDHVVRGLARRDYLALLVVFIATAGILYSVVGGILASREPEGSARAPAQPVERLENSVAVLPFANISDDPSNEFFCDGISEEILHRLSAYRDLTIIARSSSYLFKGSDLDAAAIADRLRVEYLLQGSVRKAGEDLRISASLVDAEGVQVWSQTFDRKLRDVFAIQGEIATAVSGQLVSTIVDPGTIRSRYEPLVEAYEQFLVGREYVRSRVPGWQEKAIAHFDRAIAMDPRYAAPHAGRAVAVFLGGSARSEDSFESAQRSVDAALALDPQDADALAAQALLYLRPGTGRPAEAEALLRRAIALDPNVAGARVWLFNALFVQGREDEAAEVRAEALRRNPFEPRLVTGVAADHASRGEFAQAEQVYLRLMELPQPSEFAYTGLASLYETYGRYADLVATRQKEILVEADKDRPPYPTYAFLAQAYQLLGANERADEWLERATPGLPRNLRVAFLRAYVHRLRGEFEQTAEVVESAVRATGAPVERLHPFARHLLGAVRISHGDYEAGIALLEDVIRGDPAEPDISAADLIMVLAHGYRALGQDESAEQILRRLERALVEAQARGVAQDPVSWFWLAQCRIMQGRSEEAVHTLAEAVERGFRVEGFLRFDPAWDPVRGDPAFEAILERVSEDLAAQREEVARRDGETPFSEQLDAVLRVRVSYTMSRGVEARPAEAG